MSTPSTFQQLIASRKRSHEHATLLEQYACEQSISLSAACHRLRNMHLLDADGNLTRPPRADKGVPRNVDALYAAQAALKTNPTATISEIAAHTGIPKSRLYRVAKRLTPPTTKRCPGQ